MRFVNTACVCRKWWSTAVSWREGWRCWAILNGVRRRCCRAVSHCAFFNSVQTSLHNDTIVSLSLFFIALTQQYHRTPDGRQPHHKTPHTTAQHCVIRPCTMTRLHHHTTQHTNPTSRKHTTHTTKHWNITLLYCGHINFYLRALVSDVCKNWTFYHKLQWFALHSFQK